MARPSPEAPPVMTVVEPAIFMLPPVRAAGPAEAGCRPRWRSITEPPWTCPAGSGPPTSSPRWPRALEGAPPLAIDTEADSLHHYPGQALPRPGGVRPRAAPTWSIRSRSPSLAARAALRRSRHDQGAPRRRQRPGVSQAAVRRSAWSRSSTPRWPRACSGRPRSASTGCSPSILGVTAGQVAAEGRLVAPAAHRRAGGLRPERRAAPGRPPRAAARRARRQGPPRVGRGGVRGARRVEPCPRRSSIPTPISSSRGPRISTRAAGASCASCTSARDPGPSARSAAVHDRGQREPGGAGRQASPHDDEDMLAGARVQPRSVVRRAGAAILDAVARGRAPRRRRAARPPARPPARIVRGGAAARGGAPGVARPGRPGHRRSTRGCSFPSGSSTGWPPTRRPTWPASSRSRASAAGASSSSASTS